MSVVLTYAPPAFDLSQLHDELRRAGIVPELVQAATVPAADPDDPPVPTVTLTLPDGTSQPAVDDVVAAHVPQARYDPATRLGAVGGLRAETRRKGLLVRAAKAATLADLRAVLVEHLKEEAGA